MANSETNYKLAVTSIELKAPQEFSYSWPTTTTIGQDKYRFEQLSKTQSKIEANITRTMYHSQTIFNIDTNNFIIPFFELIGTKANDIITIGRIVLKITSSGNDSANTLTLVGTSQSDSAGTTLKSTSDADSTSTLITFTADYTSNFTLNGVNTDTVKWIIDLNKSFKITSNTTYMNLGLKYTGNSSITTIDAYTEVIS